MIKIMWLTSSQRELYIYMPASRFNQRLFCKIPPISESPKPQPSPLHQILGSWPRFPLPTKGEETTAAGRARRQSYSGSSARDFQGGASLYMLCKTLRWRRVPESRGFSTCDGELLPQESLGARFTSWRVGTMKRHVPSSASGPASLRW